jgi:hypothetical protein
VLPVLYWVVPVPALVALVAVCVAKTSLFFQKQTSASKKVSGTLLALYWRRQNL